jgi:hypothetical protein
MAAILVLAFAGTGIAMADDDCHVPMNQWQPREAVQRMTADKGWAVARIKIDDGCYEVRATDEAGRTFKAKIDPATLEIVKLRYRDRNDDHHRPERERTRTMGTDASSGTSANDLSDTNMRPKAVVK